MFEITRKEIDWGGRPLILETGMVARQADSAVLAHYGGTTVLCTVVGAKKANPAQDFFPLTVHFQQKTFAVGKIPGGYFKRETKPSEKEVLTSRLIDRPIRPLFADGFKNEVQVICTVLSYDMENDSDIVAMVGTSAALTLSGLPFMGPIAAARVGVINGDYVLNPTNAQMDETDLDLIVAGTKDGVLMVESQAQELSEEQMLGAVVFGQESYASVIDMIIAMAEECAKEPWELPDAHPEADNIKKAMADLVEKELRHAYSITAKQQRYESVSALQDKALAHFQEQYADNDDVTDNMIAEAFKKLSSHIVRRNIIETGKRIDGRTTTDIRQIDSRVGVLPRTHGSALFTRGETQALVVTTLGTAQDQQMIDAIEGEYRENFMLHYNFPPYSVGEAGRMGPPGRREVGHGKLAWRAIRPLLPASEDFPYSLRVVSEITESNGSSSMATVCGTSMSLMDAGVSLINPCAGIAMGLIKDGDEFSVLSDILGDEDHLGDMDFKVAGTDNGITALQMDIKITSITREIMQQALAQAKDGRLHILKEMANAITSGRDAVSSYAPRITQLQIGKDKIRDVIGTGGKVIREICEVTGAKIDIEDDGTVKVAAVDEDAAQKAVDWIKSITDEPEVGVIYHGKVVKIMDFGAFVNFMGNKDGLVHISELADHRVKAVSDIVAEGDMVYVQCLEIQNNGKIRLSMKTVDQESGDAITSESE